MVSILLSKMNSESADFTFSSLSVAAQMARKEMLWMGLELICG
jgi:hypothetical protein